jgi:hypothetical protein
MPSVHKSLHESKRSGMSEKRQQQSLIVNGHCLKGRLGLNLMSSIGVVLKPRKTQIPSSIAQKVTNSRPTTSSSPANSAQSQSKHPQTHPSASSPVLYLQRLPSPP